MRTYLNNPSYEGEDAPSRFADPDQWQDAIIRHEKKLFGRLDRVYEKKVLPFVRSVEEKLTQRLDRLESGTIPDPDGSLRAHAEEKIAKARRVLRGEIAFGIEEGMGARIARAVVFPAPDDLEEMISAYKAARKKSLAATEMRSLGQMFAYYRRGFFSAEDYKGENPFVKHGSRHGDLKTAHIKLDVLGEVMANMNLADEGGSGVKLRLAEDIESIGPPAQMWARYGAKSARIAIEARRLAVEIGSGLLPDALRAYHREVEEEEWRAKEYVKLLRGPLAQAARILRAYKSELVAALRSAFRVPVVVDISAPEETTDSKERKLSHLLSSYFYRIEVRTGERASGAHKAGLYIRMATPLRQEDGTVRFRSSLRLNVRDSAGDEKNYFVDSVDEADAGPSGLPAVAPIVARAKQMMEPERRSNPLSSGPYSDTENLADLAEAASGEDFETFYEWWDESDFDRDQIRHGRKVVWIVSPGRSIQIDPDYVVAIEGNQFDPEKLAAVAEAVRSGQKPVLEVGYVQVTVIDETDVAENQDAFERGEAPASRPLDEGDLGKLLFHVRDGNHRTFGALIGGERRVWANLDSNQLEDVRAWRRDPDRFLRRWDDHPSYRAKKNAMMTAISELLEEDE